jgi:hypothetical protein
MVAMNSEVIGSSRLGLLAKNHDNPILFVFPAILVSAY